MTWFSWILCALLPLGDAFHLPVGTEQSSIATYVETKVLFEDDGTTDWRNHWMLDGERATV